MTDLNVITQLVGSIGFPIVMCLLLYYKINTQDEVHKLEMDKITEAVNNNTKALTELVTKLSIGGK